MLWSSNYLSEMQPNCMHIFKNSRGWHPQPPKGTRVAEARSAHCIKRSNKTRKGPKFGSSSPIIFSFLRHWRGMMFVAYGEVHQHSHLWWGPWTFVIFNGEGHELQYCHLPTFRGPPGALNNDRSLIRGNALIKYTRVDLRQTDIESSFRNQSDIRFS